MQLWDKIQTYVQNLQVSPFACGASPWGDLEVVIEINL